MSEQNDSNAEGGALELEEMKRPQLAEVAAHYGVTILPGMSNVAVVAAIRAAAGYKPQEPERPQETAAINYVWMRRITDGDGPHPIHPDEVENYRRGDWVEVEPQG